MNESASHDNSDLNTVISTIPTHTQTTPNNNVRTSRGSVQPRRVDFSPFTKEQTLQGFAENYSPNDCHHGKKVYSPSTQWDDFKIRKQYILFLKTMKEIPDTYKDTNVHSTYFNEITIKCLDDQLAEDLVEEEEEDLHILQDSLVDPTKVICTTTTNTSTIITTTTETIQKTYVNGHIDISTRNLAPVVTTSTIVVHEDDETSKSFVGEKQRSIFSYENCYAFCMSKILHSKKMFTLSGNHIYSTELFYSRYLPALRRMFKHESQNQQPAGLYNDKEWLHRVRESIMNQVNLAQLPRQTKVYFPITRPLAAFLLEVGPQGAIWFPGMATFLSLYFFGLRRSALLITTWADITSYRVFNHPDNKQPCESITIAIKGHKGFNKSFERSYPIISYEDKNYERLANSPNPIYWLNEALRALTGGKLSLKQLLEEKNKDRNGSEVYRTIAPYFIFLNRGSNNISTGCNQRDLYKRCTSQSIVLNQHLRTLARYAGLSEEIVQGITLHQSLRAGTTIEAHMMMERDGISTADRNNMMVWCRGSNVATTHYDINTTGNLTSHFMNARWNSLPTTLNIPVASSLIEDSNNFTLDQLRSLVMGIRDLGRSELVKLPFAKNVYFEENFDLVGDIIHSIQNSQLVTNSVDNTSTTTATVTTTGRYQDDFEGSIVIAMHKKYQLPSSPLLADYKHISKPRLLALLSGMQRQQMGNLIYDLVHPISNVNLNFAAKVKIHLPTYMVTMPYPWMINHVIPTVMNNFRQREIVPISTPTSTEVKANLKRKFNLDIEESYLHEKINQLNNALPDELSNYCKGIFDQEDFVTYSNDITGQSKRYNKWELLSYLMYGSVGVANQIVNYCKRKKITLYSFSDVKRYKPLSVSYYEKARGEMKLDTSHTPLDKQGNLMIDEQEIRDFFESFPYIHLLLGWFTVCTFHCPSILNRNISTDQVKEYVRAWKKRDHKATYHPHRMEMNNRTLLPPTEDVTIDAGLVGSLRSRGGSLFGSRNSVAIPSPSASLSPTAACDTISVATTTPRNVDDTLDHSISILDPLIVINPTPSASLVSLDSMFPLFIPSEIKFHVDIMNLSPENNTTTNTTTTTTTTTTMNSLSNNNVPYFLGGFTYDISSQTWSVPGLNPHGNLSDVGMGIDMNMDPTNVEFIEHRMFNPNWIVPLGNLTMVQITQRSTGSCFGCGWKLVNPQQPNRYIRYCPEVSPRSGSINYSTYLHYSCSRSYIISYNRMRHAAALCLYSPHILKWGVSFSTGQKGNKVPWTYVEIIDLFVGLKLSGYFDAPQKPWELVFKHCLILQLTNKTTRQMGKKYQYMIEIQEDTNQPKYMRYFTMSFHAQMFSPVLIMPTFHTVDTR
jgi:hypothetical protein